MNAASAPAHPLPTIVQVRELLEMLFEGVTVKQVKRPEAVSTAHAYFGVYVSDGGVPVALCGCNPGFAAGSAAALSMLAPDAAAEAAHGATLTPVMLANLHEVMNICTRLLLSTDTPHLRLGACCARQALPAAAAAILRQPSARIDFDVRLGRYGPGALAVFVA